MFPAVGLAVIFDESSEKLGMWDRIAIDGGVWEAFDSPSTKKPKPRRTQRSRRIIGRPLGSNERESAFSPGEQ